MTSQFARDQRSRGSGSSNESDRVRVIREGVASYLPDIDPEETSGGWVLRRPAVPLRAGPRPLPDAAPARGAPAKRVAIPAPTSTDYVNTIPTEMEPWFPGDGDVERRYRRWMRWNAAIMVHRAQRPGVGVGGHISTYASSAALYGSASTISSAASPTPAAAIRCSSRATPPRVSTRGPSSRTAVRRQTDGFRQDTATRRRSAVLPAPRLMPDFWEFPTVSMGLGPMNAIYQARVNHYLHDRGIKDTSISTCGPFSAMVRWTSRKAAD